MHFLCLHGRGTNSDIFESQLAALRSRISPEHTFDFIDAEFDCPPAPGISDFYPSPYLGWHAQYDPPHVQAVHDYLWSVIREDGPYDGVIGFSEGAALAASLLLCHEHVHLIDGSAQPRDAPFKVAIFFNSVVMLSPSERIGSNITQSIQKVEDSYLEFLHVGSSDPQARTLPAIFGFPPSFPSRIAVPTLHVIGEHDAFAEYSRAVAGLCRQEIAEVLVFDGGHELPSPTTSGSSVNMAPDAFKSNTNQLLPAVLEIRARSNPHGAWAKFPASDHTYTSGVRTATNLEVLNAVNKLAWLLEESLGRSSEFETLAYIGPFDLRYFIILLAAIKVGYKIFLPSPRNSTAAQLHLLSKLNCNKIATTDPEPACVPTILAEYDMTKIQIPALRQLLDCHDVPNYPYAKTYEDAKDDPIFILHTSGSTGTPKPMIYTHEFVTRTMNVVRLPAPEGFVSGNDNLRTGSWFSMLPPFHVSGLGFGLMVAAFDECVPIFPLPGKPLSTGEFLEAVKHVEMDWAFVLPVTLGDLSKDPASLDLVSKKLAHLRFVGGSVPEAAGDIVASKMPVYQATGSSETSALALIHAPNDNDKRSWNYIQVHPTINAEFRHEYGDLHEMVIVRSPEKEEYQPVFLHFPDQKEYGTRDLLSPHPTRPGFWTYRGRKDDIIVFLNGEKTNPISFEQELSRHPEVRSAIVAGAQRFEACLLVELVKSEPLSADQRAQVIERIWPTVQRANGQCPAHARVSKSKILITDPSKPMARAAKGTVQRAATVILYLEEIDRLYAEKVVNVPSSGLASIDLGSPEAVAEKIHEHVLDVTLWNRLDNGTDFFSLGMDSLQVLQLSRLLSIPAGTIYKNPSVDLLMKALSHSAQGGSASIDQHTSAMAAMLCKYEDAIDRITPSPGQAPNCTSKTNAGVVVLTGSTGAVGSYILNKLLQNDRVPHVYCLNRAQDSQTLQITRNSERRIPTEFPPDRVTFLTADLTKDHFGLDGEIYSKLLSTVTQIVHNAWPVNFNQTLQSFQPSLDGVLSLVSFAASAKLSPSIFFLSSISAVSNYHCIPGADERVPEQVITNLLCPASMGYGESKYLAERMLGYAAQKLNVKTGIARVGQIAGTAQNPHGWNKHEWLPSLVISSQYLGAIPDSLGSAENGSQRGILDRIDWVPIDQLASVLVELSLKLSAEPPSPETRVFHPINPKWVSWRSLVPTVIGTLQSCAEGKTDIKVVPFKEWTKRLRSTVSAITEDPTLAVDMLRVNPAVTLLGFYESLSVDGDDQLTTQLAIEKTLDKSPSLQTLEAVKPEWLSGWIRDWFLA
ncbi:hypothetical protein CNMCM5793_004969 [Aspergillus hiratsukae]|uniref:Carrier domain-containing protein n=1 Tax=Aspergillus hiratsukae TaxID=1194566 RepID=A0A8H6QBY8_9EURO|nr:hypothetical protein CNMCM5793_004969 [Aspergillus hiratsukae]KAF7170306.1 hypothetical protein CNMCM6106_005039 [Aspergillus hiratsukae]